MTDEQAAGGSADGQQADSQQRTLPDGGDAEASDDPAAVPVEEVHHVAELARVNVTDADAEQFASQFADILASFEALDEVPSMETTPELTNVMRADEIHEGIDREAALANAPETEDGYFKGPRVS